MKLAQYAKKYRLAINTVKDYVHRGYIRGEELQPGSWWLSDEPPTKDLEAQMERMDHEPSMTSRDVIDTITQVVGREANKLNKISKNQDKPLRMGEVRTLNDMMDKLTRLRREDNTLLQKMQVMKFTDELLEELITEFKRRQDLENEEGVLKMVDKKKKGEGETTESGGGE